MFVIGISRWVGELWKKSLPCKKYGYHLELHNKRKTFMVECNRMPVNLLYLHADTSSYSQLMKYSIKN